MKPILIPMDPRTLASLNRIAPGKRNRSEFIRQAIRTAIRQAEFRAMRDAYRRRLTIGPRLKSSGRDQKHPRR
jgi:metal-responsive CopG/Arc/MetJ family transcriptional regulator